MWEENEYFTLDDAAGEYFASCAAMDQEREAQKELDSKGERHSHKRRLYLAPVIAVFILVVLSEFHYVKHQVTYEYTVVEGDTLWDISRRYYGHGFRYIEIIVENEEEIDDPDLIYPGTVYRITVTQWVKE